MRTFDFKLIVLLVTSILVSVPAVASIEIDKLKYELVQSLKDEKYPQALQLINTLRAKKVPLGTEIIYFEAKSNLMTGQPVKGEQLLRKYINVAKAKGENYQRAIGMIIEIDNIKTGQIKAEKKAKAETIARKKSIAAEKARVFGKIISVNKEWGYAVAEPKGKIEPKGKKIFSRVSEYKTISFKLGSSKGDGKYTLTSDELSNVNSGDILYYD